MTPDFFNLTDQSIPIALIISFIGGIMTSLTPCVYPAVMITVAVFGVRKGITKIRALSLSLVFASAMILIYTLLGAVSAMSGMVFGKIYQMKWFLISVSILCFLMGLSMLGVFTIQLPEVLRNKLASSSAKSGFLGAFLMGLFTGFLAAPCTGPILIGILTFVSATKSITIGIFLLFAYSSGLSLLFVIVGTFVMSLPKSGKWLDAIKDILGTLMFLLAFYFLLPILPSLKEFGNFSSQPFLPAAIALCSAVFIVLCHTFFHKKFTDENGNFINNNRAILFHLLRITSIVICTFALFSTVTSTKTTSTASKIKWIINDEQKAIKIHKAQNIPLIIDFTAEWCEACKKIDKYTFSDSAVEKELLRFIPLKIDLTEGDSTADEIRNRYSVPGLPTVILIDSRGKERKRITNFIKPNEFLKIIKEIR